MGMSNDFDNFLIETFDVAKSRWIIHTASTARDVSQSSPLLYRVPGVSSKSIDMKKYEDDVKQLQARCMSKKRPLNATDFHNSTTPQTQESVTKKLKVVPSPSKSDMPLSSPSKIPPTSEILSLSSDTESDCDSLPVPHKTTPIPVIKKKKGKPVIIEIVDEEILAAASSSGHAKWPFKYVRAMAEGFEKMATMQGNDSERFMAAFNQDRFPRVTFYTCTAVWRVAPAEVKDRYISAGFTIEGLWKTFVNEIRACYPDGKIPVIKEKQRRRRVVSKFGTVSDSVLVKTEPESVAVKEEPQDPGNIRIYEGVIEISDSEN